MNETNRRVETLNASTEQHRNAEKSQPESEDLYRSFVEQASEGILLTDETGCAIEWNGAMETITGFNRERILGKPVWDVRFMVIAPEKRTDGMLRELEAGAREALSTGRSPSCGRPVESQLFGHGGKILLTRQILFPLAVRGGFRLAWMVSDISDQKRREAEFVKADRLESLGVLAGGIAHDFNNLLGAIYGYIDLACNAGHADGILFLAKAMDTIERARGLTRQLLTFASGGAPVLEVESLFPFVQETARVALGGSSVSCSFSVQENLWSCKMDRNQIAQVIGNIVINARQAMPGGGMIEVAASNVMVGEERRGTLSPGAYVRLSIADHGIGICREHLSRIFEPFFTTKSSGNGLGLASCHSIVRRHGGLIEVESEPGKGSVFHVFLPASSDTGSERPCAVEETPGGKGTFLVMDDESILQEVMKDILSSFGYKVVCTGDGKAAVDFFSKEFHAGRRVRGLIFDLTVRGGMSGTEAIAIIRKMDKNVPAFVASGYSDDPVMANPAVYGFTASLCKPFRRGEFAEMLNKFIESNSK